MAFAFELPSALEARVPPEARGLARDEVAMLVTDSASGKHEHRSFLDIPETLRAGDLLVVNDSATIPAAVRATRADGRTFDLHFSTELGGGLWLVEPRLSPDVRAGEILQLPGNVGAMLVAAYRNRNRLWYAEIDVDDVIAYLRAQGRPITYGYVRGSWPIDAYQTIFGREPGSVEMPSAGRPFSLRVLDRLRTAGVALATLTLHCSVASPEAHEPPIAERYRVPQQTVRAVEHAKTAGGRVIAVGTTVVRALESAVDSERGIVAADGWTNLVISKDRPRAIADALLTGFHEPKASHLSMLATFADDHTLAGAYREAIARGYLWHEFGDVHLIVAER